jgi:hypothetical protein
MGVPPYQWYYVPPEVCLATTAALGAGVLLGRAGRVRRWPSAVAVAAAAAAAVALVASAGGRAVPWPYPPVFGNWVVPARYQAVGAEAGRAVGGAGVTSPGEIGALAFSCGCDILDVFSDRGRVVPLVQQREDGAGRVMRALLRLNYARLDRGVQPRPAGYALVWLKAGDPSTQDPRVLRTWPVTGPVMGDGTLVLMRP